MESAELDSSRAPDEVKNEALRLPLRNQLALSIRRAGLEPAFGDYVDTAISAWEFWDPQGDTPARQLARLTQALERLAKTAFVAGDAEGAGQLLDRRSCFLGRHVSSLYFVAYCTSADELMLGWELDAGKLAAAARRLRETQWIYANEVVLAERVARTFIAAGRPRQAYDMLAGLRSKRALDQASIAEAYWRLGAVEEGRRIMREVARAALDDAKRDPRKAPPVALAGTQTAMGDRDGAIETLTEIRKLDGKRLDPLRAPLAGRLAFAGLDADAFGLLTGAPGDRDVLSNIAVGQARRGDFAAALATFGKLEAFRPPGGEDKARSPALKMAIVSIVRNAARAGDTDAFKQADAMRRALDPGARVITIVDEGGQILRGGALQASAGSRSLGDLARAGKEDFAVDYALAQPSLAEKLAGLECIAEALTGLPDPFYKPLAFYDPM